MNERDKERERERERVVSSHPHIVCQQSTFLLSSLNAMQCSPHLMVWWIIWDLRQRLFSIWRRKEKSSLFDINVYTCSKKKKVRIEIIFFILWRTIYNFIVTIIYNFITIESIRRKQLVLNTFIYKIYKLCTWIKSRQYWSPMEGVLFALMNDEFCVKYWII